MIATALRALRRRMAARKTVHLWIKPSALRPVAHHMHAGRAEITRRREDALKQLKTRFPLPTKRPDYEPFHWAFDGGGRHIINELIVRHGCKTMLEIGVWTGGSCLLWLRAKPDLTVIGVDLGNRMEKGVSISGRTATCSGRRSRLKRLPNK